MLLTNFKIAWRHITRDKIYSFIVVFGLAISLTICFLVVHYARYELHYDSFYKETDRIYRVTTETYDNKRLTSRSALSSQQIATALKTDFPEVADAVQLKGVGGWFVCTLKYTDGLQSKIFNEQDIFYTSSSFFRVFSWPAISGDSRTALEKPFSAVMTQSAARRYFGDTPALGKVVHLTGSFDENDYTITGVIPDLPSDSHIKISVLFSERSLEHNRFAGNFDGYTYVLMAANADPQRLKDKMPALSSRLTESNGSSTKVFLEPVKEVHLDQGWQNEISPPGSKQSIYFLLVVAAAIVIIALINYINLATSRALQRAREVGVRKISGAHRYQLIRQFVTEAVLIYALSITAALILIMTSASSFYKMVGLSQFSILSFPPLNSSELYFLGITFLIVAAGMLYPAVMISSFNPSAVLNGRFAGSLKGIALRRALVIFQFVCSVCLMVGVYIMHDQFNFMQKQDLGFNLTGTLVVKAPSVIVDESSYESIPRFKKQVEELSFVKAVTTSGAVPGRKINWTGDLTTVPGQRTGGVIVSVQIVDENFIAGYGVRLLAGRNFEDTDFPKSRGFGSITENIMLNQEALKKLGFSSPEDAIDKTIFWDVTKCRVTGVISDFHQESVKNKIEPTIFLGNIGPWMTIRFDAGVTKDKLSGVLPQVKEKWSRSFPESPFDYFFLDDFFMMQYAGDEQIMHLFEVFCGLGIVVSCLGLFGLSLFTVKQRTKEMAVRKVLGASVLDVVTLLTKEFLKPVVLSCFIALMISWYVAQQWLTGYASHVEFNSWQFIIPIVAVITIALVTVSFQTRQAVVSNTVDALKQGYRLE